METTAHTEKLNALLSKVQKEETREEFIYGVTDRSKRNIARQIADFFIDRAKISGKEKAYFFELLGTLLHAGIPLNHSLKILIHRTENRRLRRIIATLSHELEHGRSFSDALERFPDVFEESERGIVKSAEAVGNLEYIVGKIAEALNRRSEVASNLLSALIYPIAVTFALLLGIIVMLIFVVPRIKAVFEQSEIELPIATKVLLEASTVLTDYGWLLIILIIFGVILFHFYTHSETGRFSWDFRKLRIPLLGGVLRKMIVLRFVSTLGLLVESGLPITQALEYTAGAVGNEVYRVKTYTALGSVQTGERLSQALATAPFLFPETVTHMIAVGEQSASLGDLAQKIGGHYEKEIEHTLKNMTTILGPLLILVIGALTAFFALAVLSPIFSLTQSVR